MISDVANSGFEGKELGNIPLNSGLRLLPVLRDDNRMKLSLLLVAFVFATVLSLPAADAFKLPSHVKELEDLDKAIAKAEKERKGITFLLMEPGST